MSEEEQGEMIISAGSRIEGKVEYSGTIVVSGSISGEVNCGILVVLKEGIIDGIVNCIDAKVVGSVSSELNVSNHLFIDTTGSVSGKCSYGELEISKGGALIGDFNQVKKSKKKSRDLEEEELTDVEVEEINKPETATATGKSALEKDLGAN